MPPQLMTALTVGEPFPHPDLVTRPSASWDPESPQTILLCLDNISPAEEAAYQGPLRFDVCPYEGLLVLLMTPQGSPEPHEMVWFLLEDDATDFTAPRLGGHALVSLIVVEQTTGLVTALRVFTWSPHFTRAVDQQVLTRQRRPMADFDQVQRTVLRMRAQYPRPSQLRHRSIASCRAGD